MSSDANLVALREAKDAARRTLGDAYAEDLIDDEDLERRLEGVERAEVVSQVDALVEDVRRPAPPPETGLATVQPTQALVLRDQVAPVQNISAIFSETKRGNGWTPARVNNVRAIFASVVLDLRDARLPPGVTEFHVTCVFASVEVIIPPGMAIDSEASVVFAEVSQEGPSVPPDPDLPRLRITGTVVFGEIELHERLPDESWWQARKRRKKAKKARKRLREASARKMLSD